MALSRTVGKTAGSRGLPRARCLLLALVVLAAPGCGGAADEPDLAQAVRENTLDQRSATVVMTATAEVTGVDAGDRQIVQSGEIDFIADASQLVLEDHPLVSEIRQFGEALYFRVKEIPPALRGLFTAQQTWIGVGFENKSKLFGSGQRGAIELLFNPDPRFALILLSVSSVVEDEPATTAERSRGHERHLVLSADLSGAAEAPEYMRRELARLADLLPTDTLTVDVWIDGASRLRRLEYSVALDQVSDPANPLQGTAQVAMDFLRFGVATDFQRPDPVDTVELDALAGG